ncbi:hypothetical protein GCM10010193_70110 [Kitasatospora atroaurantiaca]|uniref:Uncharacterized protein n=1 Tax=Kitasatospora atroaurantiaca TaxID=285545 RepID=A0A561ENB1_9ACTN|nr:hypothetical protein [Kitasatospora atroaurantiaca]TWE17097.1 hypothetical protein FB465_2102 [Kitasatospora atroaurantiaca]
MTTTPQPETGMDPRLAEDLNELFEIHELSPGDRLDRNAIEQLAEHLRDHAARTHPHHYYYEQDEYPVVIEVTERRIIWVEADSADEAVKAVRNDGSWYERIPSGEPAIDGWHEVRPPHPHELQHDIHGNQGPAGPAPQCQECKERPYGPGLLLTAHTENCTAAEALKSAR